MTNLDRPRVVELLGRFGAVDDHSVLEAARELHRTVTESGLTWEELLRPESSIAGTDVARADDPASETPADDSPVKAEGGVLDTDKAEATRLIGRLLARKDISDNLRQELTDFRRAIAEGSFDTMDSRYVRALAKRLGV